MWSGSDNGCERAFAWTVHVHIWWCRIQHIPLLVSKLTTIWSRQLYVTCSFSSAHFLTCSPVPEACRSPLVAIFVFYGYFLSLQRALQCQMELRGRYFRPPSNLSWTHVNARCDPSLDPSENTLCLSCWEDIEENTRSVDETACEMFWMRTGPKRTRWIRRPPYDWDAAAKEEHFTKPLGNTLICIFILSIFRNERTFQGHV